MKKFITYMPRQIPRPAVYEAVDNQRLHYGAIGEKPKQTQWPIIPVINGYSEEGDNIAVLAVTEEDYPNCKNNYYTFSSEVTALCNEKKVSLHNGEVTLVPVKYADDVVQCVESFQSVLDFIEDGDELHVCVTYGSKVGEIILMMTLRYARVVNKDVYISCVVYGGYDHDSNTSKIYDETALIYMDDIVRMLAQYGDKNPRETIRRMLSL